MTAPISARESNGEDSYDKSEMTRPHTNAYSDPDATLPYPSTTEKNHSIRSLLNCAQQLLDSYFETRVSEEELWIFFIKAFRPQSIRTWSRSMQHKLITLLAARDVYI